MNKKMIMAVVLALTAGSVIGITALGGAFASPKGNEPSGATPAVMTISGSAMLDPNVKLPDLGDATTGAVTSGAVMVGSDGSVKVLSGSSGPVDAAVIKELQARLAEEGIDPKTVEPGKVVTGSGTIIMSTEVLPVIDVAPASPK